MMRAVAIVFVLVLAACSIHLREAIPDADTAVASAVKLCNWASSEHLHAELQGERWHVWDDRGNAQASSIATTPTALTFASASEAAA